MFRHRFQTPRTFISFSVFGVYDEILALVFDIFLYIFVCFGEVIIESLASLSISPGLMQRSVLDTMTYFCLYHLDFSLVSSLKLTLKLQTS